MCLASVLAVSSAIQSLNNYFCRHQVNSKSHIDCCKLQLRLSILRHAVYVQWSSRKAMSASEAVMQKLLGQSINLHSKAACLILFACRESTTTGIFAGMSLHAASTRPIRDALRTHAMIWIPSVFSLVVRGSKKQPQQRAVQHINHANFFHKSASIAHLHSTTTQSAAAGCTQAQGPHTPETSQPLPSLADHESSTSTPQY
jgi:hypothetical protein